MLRKRQFSWNWGSSTTQSGSSPTTTSDCDEKEDEENIIDIGKCDFDKIAPFCSVYSTPPEKVKSSIPELGIGIFYEIDKSSGHYVYQFQNGRLFEIWWLFSFYNSWTNCNRYILCLSFEAIYIWFIRNKNTYLFISRFRPALLAAKSRCWIGRTAKKLLSGLLGQIIQKFGQI